MVQQGDNDEWASSSGHEEETKQWKVEHESRTDRLKKKWNTPASTSAR